jgi:hypothetical protein
MASVIEGVRNVLSLPEERRRALDKAPEFAKRFVMEVGPDGVGTPRHADAKLPPLALHLCHQVPLAWLETSITLRGSYLFWGGSRANVADGPMAAIFSTNHRVEGWNVSQTKHGFMKHLMGQIYLPSIGQCFQRYGVHPASSEIHPPSSEIHPRFIRGSSEILKKPLPKLCAAVFDHTPVVM